MLKTKMELQRSIHRRVRMNLNPPRNAQRGPHLAAAEHETIPCGDREANTVQATRPKSLRRSTLGRGILLAHEGCVRMPQDSTTKPPRKLPMIPQYPRDHGWVAISAHICFCCGLRQPPGSIAWTTSSGQNVSNQAIAVNCHPRGYHPAIQQRWFASGAWGT